MNFEISFRVEIHDRELPSMSFSETKPEFEGISITPLETDKGEYRISISLKELNSYEDALKHAESTLETLLSELAYHLQCFVGGLRFNAARKIEGKNITIYPSPMMLSVFSSGTFQISASTITDLLRSTIDCPYFTMFRHSMQITNELGKFMGLYNILLSIFGDKQQKVDRFILTRDPNTPVSQSPHYPCDKETVFTRLRNQVGHFRPGTSLLKTRQEMAQNLSALQSHVVAAIKQNWQT